VVILPKKKESLQRLEKEMASLNFFDLFTNLKQQEVTVHLPKFQIEVTASLNEPLEKV
jgi:serine protease inhibitor